MTGRQLQLLRDAGTNTGDLGAALEDAVRIVENYMEEKRVCPTCGSEGVMIKRERIGHDPVLMPLSHVCLDTQLELGVG